VILVSTPGSRYFSGRRALSRNIISVSLLARGRSRLCHSTTFVEHPFLSLSSQRVVGARRAASCSSRNSGSVGISAASCHVPRGTPIRFLWRWSFLRSLVLAW
jgi:hypothetical protein